MQKWPYQSYVNHFNNLYLMHLEFKATNAGYGSLKLNIENLPLSTKVTNLPIFKKNSKSLWKIWRNRKTTHLSLLPIILNLTHVTGLKTFLSLVIGLKQTLWKIGIRSQIFNSKTTTFHWEMYSFFLSWFRISLPIFTKRFCCEQWWYPPELQDCPQ